MKLNQRIVDSLTYERPGKFVWDSQLPGFGVRLQPRHHSYVLYVRDSDKKKRLHIITYTNLISLTEAREKARKLKDGPSTIESSRLTVGKACDIYIEQWAKERKRSLSQDIDRIKRTIKPQLGLRTLENLTVADVRMFHQSIKAPIEANRTLVLLSTIYNVMSKLGYFPSCNPCRAVKRHPEHHREKCLTPDESLALTHVLAQLPGPGPLAVRLLQLTGCRKSEVLSMAWSDIDWNKQTFRIPLPKNGKARNVPLVDEAITLLQSIPRRSPWVFPNPKNPQNHMQSIKRTWRHACQLANIHGAHLHDLRHTLASRLAEKGVPLLVIAKILGHSSTWVTHRYAHISDDLGRKELEALEG